MFDGVYGANNPEEVVKLMTEQEHIAGVVFDHLAVRQTKNIFHKKLTHFLPSVRFFEHFV